MQTKITSIEHQQKSDFMAIHKKIAGMLIILICSVLSGSYSVMAQDEGTILTGKTLESGTGIPVPQAIVSVASTSESTNSDSLGNFSIKVPSGMEKIVVNYPGYTTIEVYTYGKSDITIYMTPKEYNSDDKMYTTVFGVEKLKDATNAVTLLSKSAFQETSASSVDQNLNGRIPGMYMVENSGMPGDNTWMNLRGISSIFARNEPLVIVDGMIHEISYPNHTIIEGNLLNPMDVLDVDDMVDVSVMKTGEGQFGSMGSNGYVYFNTEQNRVTSSSIIVKMYGGVTMPYEKTDVLDRDQFKSYFVDLLKGQGYTPDQFNTMYPWLNGGPASTDYYKYNSNTDWQKETVNPSSLQKYYVFLKGGDDIATYNISSGYLRQEAPYSNWRYSRYNLRLNGKVNITNRLSIVPNTKLSLADRNISNLGPTTVWNPYLSTLLKSPMMGAHERSAADGTVLYPYDDVGVFNQSNPAVLVDKGMGMIRNFQLLTSVKVAYKINSNWSISHLIGTSVNNDRVNLFIPDVGVVQIDSAKNSPKDMVTEFRSLQNHTTITYNNKFGNGHNLIVNGGLRQMHNTYKNNWAADLNTPSDDFRSLGQGTEYHYLRTNGGELSEIAWLSLFADANYNYYDKYYLRASLSYDGTSVINKNNRYNFYPSIFGAWRLTNEDFMKSSWLNDFKLSAGYSNTGNMFSSAYEMSKPTYTGRRYNNIGVVVRDYNANQDLKIERKTTINGGFDMSFYKKAVNVHLDYFMATVNNLMINQSLPYNFGFTDYIDNGGKLGINGVELGADGRFGIGKATLTLDASVTYQGSKVKSLDFINPETESIITQINGMEYIAKVGTPLNAFWGYKTLGIYNTDAEAAGMIGPNGRQMGAGDVIFEDVDGNKIINDKDKQIIGNPNPNIFGSLTAGLKIDRFEFSTILGFVVGNDMYNYVRYQTTAMDSYANQSTDVLDRWQPGSTGATLPKATIGDPNGNNVFSDRWIEDGSFVKVRHLTASYTIPEIYGLKKEIKFYITGSNLFTFSKYKGVDPETMYMNDTYYMGTDFGKIPISRSVIIGIQLSL